MQAHNTPVSEEFAEDLWSDGWEANFNHVTWNTPANGMYALAGANPNGTAATGGLPALKPTEKEKTD